ncbi:MAG TPA: hypothetical protein VKB49_25600 [Candidatus Sulfotelmatobacter sp.]|nr:hypothetical protein [Candidatus Sulfotelmatobacter sp.]
MSTFASVILSEDWSLRLGRKDQPQSKDLVFLDIFLDIGTGMSGEFLSQAQRGMARTNSLIGLIPSF